MGRNKSKRKPKLAASQQQSIVNSNSTTCKRSNSSANCPLKIQNLSDKNQPITIKDRLHLPYFHSSDDQPEDEETELQLDFKPRRYFVNGLCYLCLRPTNDNCRDDEKDTKLTNSDCPDCGVISFCCVEHEKQASREHNQLCKILRQVCRDSEGLSLAKNLQADEYRRFRLELLRIVQNGLGRRLEFWEREILLYPKLCRTCHGCERLTRCPDCLMEHYCSGGDNDDKGSHHRTGHEAHCEEYKIFRKILQSQRLHGFLAPRIPDFVFDDQDGSDELLEKDSFDELARKIFELGCDYEKIDCSSYAALAQTGSPALTAFYVMRRLLKLNMNRKMLKIHVIGAELQFECANLAVWEKLFMHLLPGVKSLRLEFCGPELTVPADIESVLKRPKLCNSCRSKGRKIDIVFHCGKLYHRVDNDKPDLVCLFNPGLYRTTGFNNQDTWPETIEKFCDYGVPILVTSYTEVELPLDIQRIRKIRDIQVEHEPRRNPYASLRPERNFVSDDLVPLIYKNYFLCVVRGSISKVRR